MKKSKIIIDPFALNRIANSDELSDNEKITFLKYVWYLTSTEKAELFQLI